MVTPAVTIERPPERIETAVVVLRRQRAVHADALADAVAQSLDDLSPFMPWARSENATVDAMTTWLQEAERGWDQAVSFDYALYSGPMLVGGASLMGRIGPAALEIGYWLRTGSTGRGLMTAAVGALTDAGLALAGVERIEIHTDLANARSQAIPRRLGYRLDRIEHCEPRAPAETGQLMIWVR